MKNFRLENQIINVVKFVNERRLNILSEEKITDSILIMHDYIGIYFRCIS